MGEKICSGQAILDGWTEGQTDGQTDRLITIGCLQSGALIKSSTGNTLADQNLFPANMFICSILFEIYIAKILGGVKGPKFHLKAIQNFLVKCTSTHCFLI